MNLGTRSRRWSMTLIVIVITAALAIIGQIPSSSATESELPPLLILESPPQPCPTIDLNICSTCIGNLNHTGTCP